MSDREAAKVRMIQEGFPAELIDPLARLFKIRQQINVRIYPRDAWVVVALLQFADRNPALDESHHALLHSFAENIIEALVNIEPILEPYIAMGWNPDLEVPRDRKEG